MACDSNDSSRPIAGFAQSSITSREIIRIFLFQIPGNSDTDNVMGDIRKVSRNLPMIPTETSNAKSQ